MEKTAQMLGEIWEEICKGATDETSESPEHKNEDPYFERVRGC